MTPCALAPPQAALLIAAINATTANLRLTPEARSVIRMRSAVLVAAAIAANQAFPSSTRRAERAPSPCAARPASCIPIDFDGIAERPLKAALIFTMPEAGPSALDPRAPAVPASARPAPAAPAAAFRRAAARRPSRCARASRRWSPGARSHCPRGSASRRPAPRRHAATPSGTLPSAMARSVSAVRRFCSEVNTEV